MIRLFVGLALPGAKAERLAALAGGIPGARWIEARNLHVTLRFVGEVDEARAADLDDALRAVRAPAFDLTLSGVGIFGSGRSPHSLWAGVERSAALADLHKRVEAAAQRAGLAPDGGRFTPHVTLARLKQAPRDRVSAFLALHGPLALGPAPVEAFTLFRSHLGRAGAEYEALADYPLDSI